MVEPVEDGSTYQSLDAETPTSRSGLVFIDPQSAYRPASAPVPFDTDLTRRKDPVAARAAVTSDGGERYALRRVDQCSDDSATYSTWPAGGLSCGSLLAYALCSLIGGLVGLLATWGTCLCCLCGGGNFQPTYRHFDVVFNFQSHRVSLTAWLDWGRCVLCWLPLCLRVKL